LIIHGEELRGGWEWAALLDIYNKTGVTIHRESVNSFLVCCIYTKVGTQTAEVKNLMVVFLARRKIRNAYRCIAIVKQS
jgi:hypothetical protein